MNKLQSIEIQHPMSTVKIRIPTVEPKAGIALFCDDLAIGYPEKLVASKIEMDVDRGAHVAVLGDNGQGKTTFLRTLAEDLTPKSGKFRWGTGLKVGYYAQHVFGTLSPDDDVLTYLERDADSNVTRQNALDIAASFLFKGNDVQKKIAVLSGGERARLVLARLLLMKCHVLLLDEPTNHLDFETVEALGRALKEFGGTLFFISHDRTFVNLVATEIIEVKNGRVLKYPGTYEEYVYHLEQEAQGVQDRENKLHKEYVKTHPKMDKADQVVKEKEKEQKAELAQFKDKISKSESRLRHLENEKENLVKEAQSNPFHFSKERNQKIKELTVLIEKEETKWLDLQSELSKLQKTL